VNADPTIIFDFETGGLEEHHPEIQLAAIAVVDWKEVAFLEAKIRFDEAAAEAEALALNHYSAEVWKAEAQPEEVVARRFAAMLEDFRHLPRVSKTSGNRYTVCRMAGHNPDFDGPRLRLMFERHGLFLAGDTYNALDTKQLALWYAMKAGRTPADFRLTTLAEFFGVSVEGAHDALADCRLVLGIAKAILAPNLGGSQ
jgi:DNA polymerase III epsilon subunit-like protein